MSAWHHLSAAEALSRLGSDRERGLSEAEAARRLAEYGPNELAERGARSAWAILWEQLTALMVVILLVAAAASATAGETRDAAVILVIVGLNAALGFFQEYRAERALAALRRMAVPRVKVRRDGQTRELSARELVPGDVLLLEAGDLVPADCRLLESANLRLQEAALTGESEPVEKDPRAQVPLDAPLAERRTMAYLGTAVTYGRGLALVVETGMRTELGRVAAMLQSVERQPTPLQRRLNELGRALALAALAIVGVIVTLGLLRGEEPRLLLLTGVSMAVAAVPEGLPAVVTIALALGAQRMLKRRALVRKLAAVETLGSVTVICSDKTGTLTENRMTVAVLDVAGRRLDLVAELGREAVGRASAPASAERSWASPELAGAELLREWPALALLLAGGALCNDAVLAEDRSDGASREGGGRRAWRALGDPTEAALVVAAARLGLEKGELERAFPRVAEQPFDSERKRMTTLHARPDAGDQLPPALRPAWERLAGWSQAPWVAFTKGAVDGLLALSTAVWVGDHPEPLDDEWRRRIETANDRLARDGMRVLGVAFRPLAALRLDGSADQVERELVFVGLVGLLDPPRPEVKAAVQTCKAAGIRPVMITGDQPLTAEHIARELGIGPDGRTLTGRELEGMSAAELEAAVEETAVYARVSPEHKLRIVRALQARGHVVAMTGDGVNDAPALKQADIGVAMGASGTEVAREAADMVLLDDNFATIVAAVEEGRVIYDNLRKFVRFMLTTNSAELAVMLLAPFLGMPLPLLPLQILWMNLVTDGPTSLALGFEPAERGTMQRPPYRRDESLFGRGMGRQIVWVGLLMAVLSLGVGYGYWRSGHPGWQTALFTTLVLAQMANVLAVRSERDSLFRVGLGSNPTLLGSVALGVGLQLAVVYLPFLQAVFGTVALDPLDLGVSLVASSAIFWAVEADKWLARRA